MSFRLRPRQVMALGAVVLFVVAASTVAHLASVARIALSAAVEEGELLARQLYHQSSQVVAASADSSPTLLQRDPGIRAMLEGMVGYSHTVVYAAIVDPSDRVLAHSDPKRGGEAPPPRESLERVKGWWTLRTVASLLREPGVYEAQVPMRMGERPFGTVRVGVSTSLLRQELAQSALHSLVLAVVALGLVAVVGLGAGHMFLRSLRKIAQRMERLARRQSGAVDLTRDDELGELAARVSQLGERIHADHQQGQSETTQMEGILDSLEDAVVVLNAKRQVVFCNQAAEALLGKSLGSTVGATPQPLGAADHPLAPFVTELFDDAIERRNAPAKVAAPPGAARGPARVSLA